ncbi:MAG: hypothetical protein UV38_C0006G0005 [candidate division TM6 bacterium GW2011_GWE2_42_60]|nr:MAG: hypothetical protein UV38_C0006G0005 [candidate division TM6 bacterium GW2011_GWE2_42_60]HBY05902.1 hypothetical protein [Candidatus Dependentiae bacterium]
MNIKSLLLTSCMAVGLLLQPKALSANDEWKVAVGAGAIIAGGALLWHGISEYNTRASLADDKESVDTVYELTRTLSQRYHLFLGRSSLNKEALAREILSLGDDVESFKEQIERDSCDFDRALARLETNYDYWARAEERAALRRRSEGLLTEGRTLQRKIHNLRTFVADSFAYLALFELVGKPVSYFNPVDPFQNIHAAEAMDRDCENLLRAVTRLERIEELDQEDYKLLHRAEELIEGLEEQEETLVTSPLYNHELQLKLQDEREQERLTIQRRMAKAEEEKAHALVERNRIAEQARWKEECELAHVRERLARVENRIKDLKRKTENPPYRPESEEFYLWIRGELTGCDC